MKGGRGTQDREERSKGIEIRIVDAFSFYQTDHTLQISETRSAKKAKLVRLLWQFISQRRCLTVSVQKYVYYESRKRKLKTRLIYEYRCEERLKN